MKRRPFYGLGLDKRQARRAARRAGAHAPQAAPPAIATTPPLSGDVHARRGLVTRAKAVLARRAVTRHLNSPAAAPVVAIVVGAVLVAVALGVILGAALAATRHAGEWE